MKYIKLLLMILFLSSCASQDFEVLNYNITQNVYFAGVSFLGNYKDNALNYPYSYNISKKIPVDSLLVNKLKTLNNPSINILTSLGDAKTTDALAMSLAIDLETTSIAKIDASQYKLVADLYSQILVFDFYEKKIINAYPINLQYIALFDHKPNNNEISEIFEGFYTGTNPQVKTNLFDLAIQKINSIQIQPSYGNRLQIANVKILPKAKKILSELNQSEDNFKTILAQSFSRYLVDNQKVAILPYTKGQTIGSKMAARFVNGDIYNLEIPEADYLFNIDIADFKTLTDNSQNQTTVTQGFFVYTKIQMLQPDLNKIYMDSKFRGSENVVLFKGQQPALKLSYTETLMNLFDGYTRNITQRDDDWYEKTIHPDMYNEVEKQFKQIKEIVKHCR